ncbi:DUF6286 domain-containing protein [Amycolatopsis sp. lyj-108]|uniref:DUF6286 domain-containing protein n=1 Tax=Amycolatopsis sp. lyj-108 TaxID=2789286 RepID=UPI00397CBE22
MKRLPRRSIPAVLTALVMLAACVLVAAVAIQLILGQTPWISYQSVAGQLHATQWNDPIVAVAGGVTVLIGTLLLFAAILPGRLVVLPLAGGIDSGASRHSYHSTLRASASGVDGVAGATVKVKRRTIIARVRTERTTTDGLSEAVGEAIGHRLAQITPATVPTIKVKVTRSRS